MNSFVGFSKGKSIFSTIIMWAQMGRYSHAFFAFEYQSNWYVVDSSRNGIKIRTMEVFAEHSSIVKKFTIHSTDEQCRQIFKLCAERSYDKYPMIEIIGNACQLIIKWLTFGLVKIDNPFSIGERSPRCQELVAIILRDIYHYKINENLDDTDLVWLDTLLSKSLKRM